MNETKTIFKWVWVWDFEKEEEWLNEMARNGWVLDGVGFCSYRFRRCQPEEYIVRLEMHSPDEAYLRFMEDTGAEYVGRMTKWIYFRKKSEEGPFDLFSDIDSRVAHLDRIGKMLLVVGLLNLGIGVINSLNASHLGWLNLLCSTLLMYALGRIHGKKEALERDRLLHE